MSWAEFWVVFVTCALTMLACRVLPLLLLKGRELPEAISRALGFIPAAAFAALVTNDLFDPHMLDGGVWPAAAMLLSALCVIVVAVRSHSLVASAVVGVVAYALLLMVPL